MSRDSKAVETGMTYSNLDGSTDNLTQSGHEQYIISCSLILKCEPL